MNLNEQYFLILRGPKRRILKAAGRYETADGAERAGNAQPKDYDVIRGDKLGETLNVEGLVALHNALCAERDKVATFDSADAAQRKFVHMYTMANGGDYDEPPAPGANQSTTEPSGSKENDMSEENQGNGTTEPKKKAAKKAKSKKAKAKKPAAKKAKGGARKATAASGPREGTIAAYCVERFAAGDDVATVAKAAAKKFPDSADVITNGYVSWHRWNAKKKGWLK